MPRYEEGMVAWYAKEGACNWRNYYSWELHINQGWREAELKAHVGADFLFEYRMPNDKTYYHEVGIGDDFAFRPTGKSVNWRDLPSKWEYMAEWFSDMPAE